MYQQEISRSRPALFMFLLDRSDSMKAAWAGSPGLSLAEGAAQALNRVLYELCLSSLKEADAPPRHYFDIGVFGYGRSAASETEAVESAFGGALAGRSIVSISELATNPLDLREVRFGIDEPPSRMPIWIEPIHGQRTPMCAAIAAAGGYVAAWVNDHPDSFPPIVINITDGWVTDSPFDGAPIQEWARRLQTLRTSDGTALLFNIFLSPDAGTPVVFPSGAQGLPDPGPILFDLSSELPAPFIDEAARVSGALERGARGFAFNANMVVLSKFLEVGTKTAENADH